MASPIELQELSVKINENQSVFLNVEKEVGEKLKNDHHEALRFLKHLCSQGLVSMEMMPSIDEALEKDNNEKTTDSGEGSANWYHWNREATLMLINQVERNDDQFMTGKKKTVWTNIASKLREKGFNVNGEQCDSKWKALKIMYKKVSDHNNRSGYPRREWEYFDVMDQFLHDRPELLQSSTINSRTATRTLTQTDKATSTTDFSANAYAFLSPTQLRDLIPTRQRGYKRKALVEKEEEGIERRHQERLRRQDRFLDLMQQLIEKLPNPTNK